MNNTNNTGWVAEVQTAVIAYLTGGVATFSDIERYMKLACGWDLTKQQLSGVMQGLRLDNRVTRKGGKYGVRR